jgi:hypothetical protein
LVSVSHLAVLAPALVAAASIVFLHIPQLPHTLMVSFLAVWANEKLLNTKRNAIDKINDCVFI